MAPLSYTTTAQNILTTYNLQQEEDSSLTENDQSPTLHVQYNKSRDQARLTNTISRLSAQSYAEIRRQKGSSSPSVAIMPPPLQDKDYWGVEQTASRITSTAISLSGKNFDKFTVIRDAIEKGFVDARIAFGGTLPRISQQTRHAVFAQLDKWARALNLPPDSTKNISGDKND
ncbi:hypothetical protein [Desulfotalea psychrophila]|uniref:Uncharacterized protein n=1 Tax=Desulfotalea psychrophila (strain LSv54 / DSM 12343) TaxID=177439 RepID=Q6AJR5_DESPS|nr:hypothetical protein [Desulfotalea psychrophila]CAG37415.1 unknown protein [Desulfotalea psychrophila LSv54]